MTLRDFSSTVTYYAEVNGRDRLEAVLGVRMKKHVHGVVFASPRDHEYDGMAHLWTRDAETAYWFSLTRAVDSDDIEVTVSDQLTYVSAELDVTLCSTEIVVKVSAAAARALDGYFEYVVVFHPESQDFFSVQKTLETIFRGKSGLVVST